MMRKTVEKMLDDKFAAWDRAVLSKDQDSIAKAKADYSDCWKPYVSRGLKIAIRSGKHIILNWQ